MTTSQKVYIDISLLVHMLFPFQLENVSHMTHIDPFDIVVEHSPSAHEMEWIYKSLENEERAQREKGLSTDHGIWNNRDLIIRNPTRVRIFKAIDFVNECPMNEGPVGFILFDNENVDSISIVWVHPTYRKNGYGSAMLGIVEDRVFKTKNVFLVQHVDDSVLPFYEANGYQVVRYWRQSVVKVKPSVNHSVTMENKHNFQFEVFVPQGFNEETHNRFLNAMSDSKHFGPSQHHDLKERMYNHGGIRVKILDSKFDYFFRVHLKNVDKVQMYEFARILTSIGWHFNFV